MMISNILDIPYIYNLWQSPFVEQKSLPFKNTNHSILSENSIVVEPGCGPGTNYYLFNNVSYYGFDVSGEYISYAGKSYPEGKFFECDVTSDRFISIFESLGTGKADIVFINSLLHHLDDKQVRNLFNSCKQILKDDGKIHITDLVLPEESGIPRFLALADRGRYARPESEWNLIISQSYNILSWKSFEVTLVGVPLWKLFYCVGGNL